MDEAGQHMAVVDVVIVVRPVNICWNHGGVFDSMLVEIASGFIIG